MPHLHGRAHDGQAFLWAFDLLVAPAGIQYTDHLEGDGVEIFAHACRLGLEGVVSKDRMRPYRSSRTKTWLTAMTFRRQGPLSQ
jgi:hypothetical protein